MRNFNIFKYLDMNALAKLLSLIKGLTRGLKYTVKYKTNPAVWQDSNITSGKYIVLVELPDGTLVTGTSYGDNNGIKYSTDKGVTWQNSHMTSGYFDSLVKLSDGTLLAGGNNGIVYSTDGVEWLYSNIKSGNYGHIVELSDGTLLAGGFGGTYSGIIRSTDKGARWHSSNITSSSYRVRALVELSDGTLVVGSDKGIKYSTDKGLTWQDSNITSGSYGTLVNLSDGTLVASNSYASGIQGIIRSTDKGVTWQNSNITSGKYSALVELSDGTLVAGCSNGIKYSTDKGLTWQDSNITSGNYNGIVELSDGTLIAISTNGSVGIKYSTDKGVTWQDSNITGGLYTAIVELSDGTLVVGGGGIKYSTDKGVTWQDSNITSGSYGTIVKLSDGTLVAGGFSGRGIKYVLSLTEKIVHPGYKTIFIGKQAKWNALSTTEQNEYSQANLTDAGMILSKDSNNNWIPTAGTTGDLPIFEQYISPPVTYTIDADGIFDLDTTIPWSDDIIIISRWLGSSQVMMSNYSNNNGKVTLSLKNIVDSNISITDAKLHLSVIRSKVNWPL